MRIAYVAYRDPFTQDGVVKKINTQAALWRAAGHDVTVFCLSPSDPEGKRQELDGLVVPVGDARTRLAATRHIFELALGCAPDLVYLRHDLYLPPAAALARRVATVVEINSDDAAEWRARSRLKALYVGPNRYATFRKAAGFVCVTHELARAQPVARHAKPTIVIANGAAAASTHTLPPPGDGKPRLVFVGNRDQPWHGVDKIPRLAASLPDHEFDIVGYRAGEAQRVPPNVTFHGFLPQTAYESILAQADVAIGTLALHRNSMNEASPLKVREYLLSGIPTITAYEDTDFAGETPWFILKLPNTEDNVSTHSAEIAAFVERVGGRRVPREAVLEKLSSEAKELKRLAFLEELADTSNARLHRPTRTAAGSG